MAKPPRSGVLSQTERRAVEDSYWKQRRASESVPWTAVVQWHGAPDETEEIDVEAADEATAREKVLEQLRTEYEPGGAIVKMIRHCW